ncbi:putative WD40/YVTN repeat-like-containing domain, WD40 repeat protein [Trachipleistophora hominis]|uniref:Putative WD40/YVTN repeat-like-containing domain, WD40 repeat protein n=1 Tax=Trachipleistophora hominis TaxID=72359 RepID=L7JYP9_TRAHO|nr:putative WD40/YVTN repeat-like-containing domain, WD40 repeat protein [Trachipleistophora hominis]
MKQGTRPAISRASIYKPLTVFTKRLTNYSFLCCDTFSECVISALGDDSGHLFLMDTDIDERKFLNTEIGVSSSAIFDVCWLTNSLIGIASGDSNVYLFDVFKGEFTQRRGHTKSVRCVKHAAGRVYTGGSDGKVFCWDVRSKDPVLELNFYPRGHKMVSALELNREEEYTIYGTATPGTILNTWDLRYTKRGMYISEQNSIANAITNSIYHKDRHIYLLLSNSGVLRLTETGTFMNYVQPGSTYGVSHGKIDYSAHLDLVLAGFANKVVVFDAKYTHLACTHDIDPINGLNCIRRNNFLTYDEYGRVTIYEMVFKETQVQII